MMEGLTRESIKPLLELQRIDSAIDRLTARRADLPEQRELDEIARERSEVAAQRDEQRTIVTDLTGQQQRLETEIGQLDDRRTSEEKRMYSGEVNNPRELSNISAELDSLARRKTHLEDQELEVMEQREALEAEVGQLDARVAELDAKVTDVTARRDAATVEIDKELGELGGERETIVPSLPAELLKLYEELRGKYRGLAVGALEDGTCRACSLPLSPAARDEIKRSDDPLIRCENCRRLLVIR